MNHWVELLIYLMHTMVHVGAHAPRAVDPIATCQAIGICP